MKLKLTKKTIAAQPLPEKGRTVINDAEFPNLSLISYPSGKRTWHVFYRTSDRRQHNAKIGLFPILGVEEARTRAREWLVDVSRGTDPATVRKGAAAKKTVADLAAWFITHHVDKKLKPTTGAEYQRILDKHILPALGRQKLDAVSRDLVHKLHDKMSGTPRQANLTMAVLRKMLNEAIRLGWRTNHMNPAYRIRHFKENKRERYLDKDEQRRLWGILETASANPYLGDAVLALQLLLLTGRRKGEILNLTWHNLDLDRGLMKLTDSKVGPKDYQLDTMVTQLLRDAQAGRRQSEPVSLFVIRGRGGKGRLIGLQKIWQRIRRKAGLDDVRLHDLRHSYASVAINQGADLSAIKELLGHSTIATTQRYTHLYTETARKNVARVGAGLREAFGIAEVASEAPG